MVDIMLITSSQYYELILMIALMILCGMFVGRFSERWRIPSVSGYLFIGIVFGLILILTDRDYLLDTFMALTMFFLGFIAFSIGLELDFKKLKGRAKEVLVVTLTQATMAFAFTTAGL